MKRLLMAAMLLAAVTTGRAQVQQGYVKTKGVLQANGSVTPGSRVQGATVTIRGVSSMVS